MMPTCCSNCSRRGEAEASTRGAAGSGQAGGSPCGTRSARTAAMTRPDGLFVAEGDAALGQVIGRHLDVHAVAREDANAVLAHLAGGMRQHFMVVVQLHAEHRVGDRKSTRLNSSH